MKKSFTLTVLFSCLIVYIIGLFIPLMEIDAAQYASISREMLDNKSYLQVFDLGKDYLDKPPMLFWLSALSMKFFGVHGWSYRLPSLLFSFLSVFSTYKLASLFYKKETAVLSALVLASCQAVFLINHDVRTDTMLMGWVIFSIWQLAAWYQTKKWSNFFLACIGIAGGMMTKGPIALMVPVFALAPHFILRREWKQLFRWEYLLAVIVIGILLIPMSIGLYQQYDLHPGKIIHGVPIKSGLRFFYWTQSFGRITGESEWKENSSFFFLMQNMLWSFLPWIIFFLIGLFLAAKKVLAQKFRLQAGQEFITTGGFIITYCALGSSQAQLPHYIFVVFPLAAIVTAVFLDKLLNEEGFVKWRRPLFIFHISVFILLWGMAIALLVVMAKDSVRIIILSVFITGCVLRELIRLWVNKDNRPNRLLGICFYSIIGINFFLNLVFYPSLLQYQMGNTAAEYINQNKIPLSNTYVYGMSEGRTLDFYAQHIFQHKTDRSELAAQDIIIASQDSLASLKSHWPQLKTLYTDNDYHVTTLSLPFLTPSKREQELKKYVIVELRASK